MINYFGPPSFFVTVAPSDMDSVLTLRLAHVASNATVDMNFTLPSLAQRMKNLADNPVAAAQVYQRLIECMLQHLIGVQAEHCVRTSHPPVDLRVVGILGVPIAFAGVTEVQGRQSAHGHFDVWVDLSPVVMQECLNDVVAMRKIAQRMDSVLRAYIPDAAKADAAVMSTLPCVEPTLAHRDTRNTVQPPFATSAGSPSPRGYGI
jgi:hypothetical protein